MAERILLVEDEEKLARMVELELQYEGYEVEKAFDGRAGWTGLSGEFDLVLLDIMLPVMDGWSVLKKIRENDKTPVIMLTAKGETQDKVAGLEGGADDYIVKPFEMKEVLARIHAVLRRTAGGEEEGGAKKLAFDKLVINLDSYELIVNGQPVDTPPKEPGAGCSTWPPPPTGYSPATSCWTRCGASTTSAIPVPWTCISSACGRSWRASASSGASKPCGVSVTSLRL